MFCVDSLCTLFGAALERLSESTDDIFRALEYSRESHICVKPIKRTRFDLVVYIICGTLFLPVRSAHSQSVSFDNRNLLKFYDIRKPTEQISLAMTTGDERMLFGVL
jgi:hypothetical protein